MKVIVFLAAVVPQFHNGLLTPLSKVRNAAAESPCSTPQWPRPQRKTLACCASPGSPVRPYAERKRLSDLGVATRPPVCCPRIHPLSAALA
jgi:hypothetical protein